MKIAKKVARDHPDLEDLANLYARRVGKVPEFYEDFVSPYLTMVYSENDLLVWEFEVKDIHCNRMGSLHGGCAATIIDICSSFAILVHEGKHRWDLIGISSVLQVSYVRGVASGEKIRLECEVQKMGKNLGNIHTKVYDSNDELLYFGPHTKYCIDMGRL
ncbi:unnamed protein product [Cunninghamella blakesleeana]